MALRFAIARGEMAETRRFPREPDRIRSTPWSNWPSRSLRPERKSCQRLPQSDPVATGPDRVYRLVSIAAGNRDVEIIPECGDRNRQRLIKGGSGVR
jgi:hypothetical protein